MNVEQIVNQQLENAMIRTSCNVALSALQKLRETQMTKDELLYIIFTLEEMREVLGKEHLDRDVCKFLLQNLNQQTQLFTHIKKKHL